MDKNNLNLFSLSIRELLNNRNINEAILKIEQSNLSEEELNFIFECLRSSGYDHKTDSFFLSHSNNSAFFSLVDLVQIRIITNKEKDGNIMDKIKLNQFSLLIRELLNKGNTTDAQRKIEEANFNKEELDFIFKCLHTNGYDPETDSFYLCESDNSAFLNLVNVVQSKTTVKK